jgi:hypothetical protein
MIDMAWSRDDATGEIKIHLVPVREAGTTPNTISSIDSRSLDTNVDYREDMAALLTHVINIRRRHPEIKPMPDTISALITLVLSMTKIP